MVCKYFLLFCRLSSHFVDFLIYCLEAFPFAVVPHIDFCFCCLCFFFGHIQKNDLIAKINDLPYISSRSFIVSGVMCKPLIHFELICVSIVR